MPREKRLMNFCLSHELLLDFTRRVAKDKISLNAEVVGVYADWQTNHLVVMIEDQNFAPVLEGEMIPRGGLLDA